MADANTPVTLVDWLDDLCVRFLLNLPASELSSVPRLCFQVEEAQWYYEDFVRPAVAATTAPPLPHLPLRQFCLLLFQHCPLFSGFTDAQHLAAYEEFLAYKVRVPVRGAILLDEKMEKLVLVRGWKKGSSWSFPRGKINKDERDLDCAIREVYEETGFDIATSGLLPENYNYEDQVGEVSKLKFIDITMREQHVRLFVFRGVPLDTIFETKTRKEISKIAWYAIKDLPGFKKQRHHAQQSEAEMAQANKFYMVAPFLGHLKKWIHQQRKNDALEAQRRARDSVELTGTEDETEDQTPEPIVANDSEKEDALKRLLSIGGAPPPVGGTNGSAPQPNAHAADLLAMLQRAGGGQSSNGAQGPHTPFDQIDAFAPQPETPQPQHLRQPSLGQPQQQRAPPPPQYPFSPQTLPQEQQQRNFPLHTPNVFGPSQFPPNLHSARNFTADMAPPSSGFQPHAFPPRPNMARPPYPSGPPYPLGSQSNFPFQGAPASEPRVPPPPEIRPPFREATPYDTASMAPQGAPSVIGSGPSAPHASQLPPPRLNAHTMRLLDAFQGGPMNNRATIPPLGQPSQAHRPSSTHQTALLDLFKKPAVSESAAPAEAAASPPPSEEPLSPTLTDVTEKPPQRPTMEERRPTLNEITRTLGPIKTKAKKPPAAQAATPTASAEPIEPTTRATNKEMLLFDPYENVMKPVTPTTKTMVEQSVVKERPKSGQLFDPYDHQMKSIPSPKTEAQGSSPVRKILQRPSSKQGSRSPGQHRHAVPATISPSPVAQNGNQARPSSFTILTRPGSSKGQKSPGLPVTPTSPVQRTDETPKPVFQPQLLKRPKAADVADREKRPSEGNDAKKEQLLALFSKETAAATPQGQQPPARASAQIVEQDDQPRNKIANANALLGLFNTDNTTGHSNSSLKPSPSPDPPPAPKLSPSPRKVTPAAFAAAPAPAPAPLIEHHAKDQRSLLLDLFHNNKPSSSPVINSPGTPISPFTLGTPTTHTPEAKGGNSAVGASFSASSPVEGKEKEFLMGYLNGVVQGERYRGAGRR